MKVLILLMSISIALTLTTCRGVLEPDFSAYNKLAISALIESNRHIVVIDCNDRSNFEIISPLEHSAWEPIYSPNKRYILYGDSKLAGNDRGYHLVLFDTYMGKSRDWPDPYGYPFSLIGQYAVWDLESNGFYYSEVFMSNPLNIKYLNVKTNEVTTITDDHFSAPMGIKDSETLIVLSQNKELTGGPDGYYYMDMSGEFLGPVENPNLRMERNDELGIYVRGVYELEYHAYRDLYVFALKDSSVSGTAICVS